MWSTVNSSSLLPRYVVAGLEDVLGALVDQVQVSPASVYPQFVKPNLTQRLRAKFLGGMAKAYTDDQHFSKPTKIYIWKCPVGFWILDYRHGFSPHFLCPKSKTSDCLCEV